MTDIEPGRVSGIAMHPTHRALRLWAVVASCVWLATSLTWSAPPVPPAAPTLDAAVCAAAADAPTWPPECALALPGHLARLPPPAAYASARQAQLVEALKLDQPVGPLEPSRWRRPSRMFTSPPPLQTPETYAHQATQHVDRVLMSLDGFGLQQTMRRVGTDTRPPPPLALEPLGAIGTERDWSRVRARSRPELSLDPELVPGGPHALETRILVAQTRARWDALEEAVEAMTERYAAARLEAVRGVWEPAELAGVQAYAVALDAWRATRTRRWVQAVVAVGSFVIGAFLMVGAWRTRPQRIAITPHAVHLGRRTISWERVAAVDWRGRRGWVGTDDGRWHDLGPLQLTADLRVALEEASVRARERRQALLPLDADALSEARRLVP